MTAVRKAVAIRNKFTDELQAKNFSGYDYAVITQQMKRWLHLGDVKTCAGSGLLVSAKEDKQNNGNN